jgi:hypothetical protein
MSKPHIFISHISEERDLAVTLKKHLVQDFLGLIEVFVSSDLETISAGQDWLASLEEGVKKSALLIVLCSHASLRRPWVNFEIGLAWEKIPIIPVCHSGLEPSALPIPLNLKQGFRANDEEGIRKLYFAVAKTMGGQMPKIDIKGFVQEIESFEKRYEPSIRAELGPVSARAKAARRRVYEALEDFEYNWRSLSKLAVVSGLTEDEVLELLIMDDNVKFGRGKRSGERIARLKNR